MKNIPNPQVFHSRVRTYSAKIPAESTFSATIILVGNGNDRLPAVIRAMVKAGMLGLGRKRAKFRLLEVVQNGPGPLSRLIMSNQQIINPGIPEVPVLSPAPGSIRFSFLTPYLLPTGADITSGFNLTKMIMQIIRRISSLQEAYTEAPLEDDFKSLKKRAETPAVLDEDLFVEENYSYFGNKKRFSALRGSLIMDLHDLEQLWPWLYLGQWLNVGKQASKGFGRYRITVVEDACGRKA